MLSKDLLELYEKVLDAPFSPLSLFSFSAKTLALFARTNSLFRFLTGVGDVPFNVVRQKLEALNLG